MFSRRVFSSTGLPRAMWSTMHVQSASQAARMLPMFTPIANVSCKASAVSQLTTGPHSVAIASAADIDALSLIPIEAIIAQLMCNSLSLLTIFHCSMARYPPTQVCSTRL
jgi:ATP/ADP translocase